MRIGRLLSLVVVLLVVTMILAQAVLAGPPGLPSLFYGQVLVPALAPGARVHAFIGGQEIALTNVVLDGQLRPVYVLDLPADDPLTPEREGGNVGETVTFLLELAGGRRLPVVQKGVWLAGGRSELHLQPYRYIVLPLVLR